jgi:hypothetical protein
MLRPLAAALLLAAALPAAAQNRASFDCVRAKSDVEKAICASAELSALDRNIAAVFGDLRRRLDRDAVKVLVEEQATFNGTRELAMDSPNTTLKDYMGEHLKMLRRIQPPAANSGPSAFLGEWASTAGTVTIKPGKGGSLQVSINTVAAVSARWVCDVSGEARLQDGKLVFTEDEVTITLSRRGQSLAVAEKLKDGQGRDYCGANGAVEGGYLKLRPGR